jgi:hypothetical protein
MLNWIVDSFDISKVIDTSKGEVQTPISPNCWRLFYAWMNNLYSCRKVHATRKNLHIFKRSIWILIRFQPNLLRNTIISMAVNWSVTTKSIWSSTCPNRRKTMPKTILSFPTTSFQILTLKKRTSKRRLNWHKLNMNLSSIPMEILENTCWHVVDTYCSSHPKNGSNHRKNGQRSFLSNIQTSKRRTH